MPPGSRKAAPLNDFSEIQHVVHVLHISPFVLLVGQSNAFLITYQELVLK
jgi:hypothetical protein